MRYWQGQAPEKCDICARPITLMFVDGRMQHVGSWAIMCPHCFKQEGSGLGTGRGQQYRKGFKGQWFKAAG